MIRESYLKHEDVGNSSKLFPLLIYCFCGSVISKYHQTSNISANKLADNPDVVGASLSAMLQLKFM